MKKDTKSEIKKTKSTQSPKENKLSPESEGKIVGYLLKKKFYFHDVRIKKTETIDLHYKKPGGCDDLILKDQYFIIGGGFFSNEVIAFPLPGLSPAQIKCPLNNGRVFSTSIGIKNQYIITIGGRVDGGLSTNSCEKYILNENKWKNFISLNIPREVASLGFFNERYIYVCEGRSNWNFINTFEKCDLLDLESGWTLLDPSSKTLRVPRGGAFCAQINNQDILIAGGTDTFDDHAYADIWRYKIYENSNNEQNSSMQRGGELYPNLVVHNHKIYQLGYSYLNMNYDLFIYSYKTGKFKIIPSHLIWLNISN